MVAFSNPVVGTIYAKGAAHPAGTFVVTATFADHVASGRAPGIDIGNGACGALVFTMGAGVISLVKLGTVGATTSDKASIVRVKHPNGWESGVAHLKVATGLAVGQAVGDGAVLGTCDKIGASACHVHFGVKDPNGIEVDAWPYLRQNGATEDEMVPIPPGKFVQLANKVTKVTGAYGANFRAERLTTAPVLKLYPVGTVFTPLMQADDGTSAGGATPTRWFGGFGLRDDGFAIFGWMHSSVVAVPSDIPAPAPDCTAAVKAATDPLNARIANAQKALA
jgi:murein DD-endopeptidase MepM/ murein hydrolase activator NlpD